MDFAFDAIVVGIGHAGVEAALALARLGNRTLALSVSIDNAGYLACNPSIGGTAKGHLVREVDALGGEMGKAADKTMTHLRMLNLSKGVAVHSLRAQIDKYEYRDHIKSILENQPNLYLRQGEAKKILTDKDGKICGVETVVGIQYTASVVVLACGVYLNSSIIVGSSIENIGPSGFPRANYLADSLRELGFVLRRFKTGTPARVKRDSVDLNKLEIQPGEDTPYSFSAESKVSLKTKQQVHCYLGYTNKTTHQIISDNLTKSPKYGGLIKGAGARYCPSVEDKIVRFSDKERHPFFLEPESNRTQECYVQGLSTGLPAEIQFKLYRSIEGFENVEIMRDAYAIEYDCIDPTELYASLESKRHSGLFFAGQINGTSGYEEAAAQGLVAGINANKFLKNLPPIILPRESSYTGVLIDDLTTKGTEEPYRMMTSRAEYRLLLRQDNADLRLFEEAQTAGLLSKKRIAAVKKKIKDIEKGRELLKVKLPKERTKKYLEKIGEPFHDQVLTLEEVIRRNAVTYENFMAEFDTRSDFVCLQGQNRDAVKGIKPRSSAAEHTAESDGVRGYAPEFNTLYILSSLIPAASYDLFIEVKYQGYLQREKAAAHEARRVGDLQIPMDFDYAAIKGLRNEAKEKLQKLRPLTVGQASRISGVTPADITVLIFYLKK